MNQAANHVVAGIDTREQLVNDRESGPIHQVSLPMDIITKLHGIMLDFDPDLYRTDRLAAGALDSPVSMFESLVRPWLSRHPLLSKSEVRDTGRGLHAIGWLDPPVIFQGESEREKWAAAVRAVQCSMPTDPFAPGITALTRAVGSVNAKTGRVVSVLQTGTPIESAAVLKFVSQLRAKPFRVIAETLFGQRCTPCPVCQRPGSALGVQDRGGNCYVGGHQVGLADLFDCCFADRAAKEVA